MDDKITNEGTALGLAVLATGYISAVGFGRIVSPAATVGAITPAAL